MSKRSPYFSFEVQIPRQTPIRQIGPFFQGLDEAHPALYLRNLSVLGKSAGHEKPAMGPLYHRREMGDALATNECPLAMSDL